MSEMQTKERAEAPPATAAPTAANARVIADKASSDWWYSHDQRVHSLIRMWLEGEWWEGQNKALIDVMGEVLAKERQKSQAAITKLTERIIWLEGKYDFEARFALLADEIERRSEIPQSELLEKTEALQRQLDGLKTVVGLDARVRELAERVSGLEKTNSLEARFAKLADEVNKREPEIPYSELLIKVEGLQHQFDELKKSAAQPGPQGPPGTLPLVREYAPEHVHYERDVVTHAGALWQALCDTVHAPPHDDWACLARAGRDGITPTVKGTYDVYVKYRKLDIVAMEGASWVAKYDNPGICPGDGWQLMSKQGKQGKKGECIIGPRGQKGDQGEPGATLHSWQPDPVCYCVSPVMSDGTVGPMMELRGLFEQFIHETGGGYRGANNE